MFQTDTASQYSPINLLPTSWELDGEDDDGGSYCWTPTPHASSRATASRESGRLGPVCMHDPPMP